MSTKTRQPKSTPTDLAQGQIVIVTARWILVLAGLILILLTPGPLGQLRLQVMVLLALAVANFYLCAQIFMRRPAMEPVMYAASLADLVVVALIIISQQGFESGTFVFFFPALLAISVAFPGPMLLLFTGSAMAMYAMIGIVTLPASSDLQLLVIRLLMLAAVAVCGYKYSRIERNRRQVALAPAALSDTPIAEAAATASV
jgi:hypothetical protein